MKIMQIELFHGRKLKKMKFLEFPSRIKKHYEKNFIPNQNHENREIFRIPCQINENHKQIIISC